MKGHLLLKGKYCGNPINKHFPEAMKKENVMHSRWIKYHLKKHCMQKNKINNIQLESRYNDDDSRL